MAEVFIAATPDADAQAGGLAQALKTLGFDAAAGAPGEAEIANLIDDAKCVIGLWSHGTPTAEMAMLAALAHERKKLVNAELATDATPAPFRTAPRVDLALRDRTAFKSRFQALVGEVDKLSPTKANVAALPSVLAVVRSALLKRRESDGEKQLKTLGVFAAAVAALFVVGFGAGRVINLIRSGELSIASLQISTPRAEAAATPSTLAPALTSAALERTPWREVAARIDETLAQQIETRAAAGDADAQTLACLGHMAGTGGFLPSPTAASEQCDLASAQHNAAALYLSWQLRRTAPHAGIDDATANERLRQAAEAGFTAAQIDYAASLPGDRQSQVEAGRLWLAAAERGDPRAQFFYARWLRDSPAGPQDPTAALPFLQRAAEANQPDALHMLATLYRDGVGAPRNLAEAEALYDRAARLNYAPSMSNLADMLRDGSPEERARSIALYRQLACMTDEHQIQPRAVGHLRALQLSYSCG
ncbi:MAG: tetratricopeptide repeat protein [Hyphomonadaceae bacterium]